jgi:hypothetical protein
VKYPELSIADPQITFPIQLVAAAGSMRKIKFQQRADDEKLEAVALRFAKEIASLTNDLLT